MAKTIAFLVLSGVLLVQGCAMVGQPPESVSGNSETRLGPDVFRIPAPAPDGDPSPEKSQDMALLRAAGFSLQHGYRFFAVISDKDTGEGAALSSDSSIDYLTYAPDQASIHPKPDLGLLIQGFADKPAKIFVFDASFLQSSVREKYGLPEESLDQVSAPAGPAPMKSLYDDDQPSSPAPAAAAPADDQRPASGGMRSLYPDE